MLSEGDDLQDPIADAARAILDGHIVLSRSLAEEGVYPAIDVEASISRAMPNIVDESHLKSMQRFKQLLSRYEQNRDLVNIGAYTPGADPETDAAIERFPHLRAFIQQGLNQSVHLAESLTHLQRTLEPNGTGRAANVPLRGAPARGNAASQEPAPARNRGPLAAQHRGSDH